MKIVLLGDSIKMGYEKEVEKHFRERGFDYYSPTDNCRFVKYFLRFLFDEKENLKDADVIHFNIGHWDLCQLFKDRGDNGTFSTLEEYKEGLIRITELLLKITPKLIFATTTPVRPENPYNDNKVIDKFNDIATDVMTSYGVKVNDLNSLLRDDIYKYICDDNIHLSEDGIAKCAEQVISSIEEMIK